VRAPIRCAVGSGGGTVAPKGEAVRAGRSDLSVVLVLQVGCFSGSWARTSPTDRGLLLAHLAVSALLRAGFFLGVFGLFVSSLARK
jgi:hypothetical protein